MPQQRFNFFGWSSGLVLAACAGLAVVWYSWHGGPGPASAGDSTGDDDPAALAKADEQPDVLLDEAQREFIWQAEHHGTLLNKYGFKPLTAALARPDAARLRTILAADFEGRVPERPRLVTLSADLAGVARVEREEAVGGPFRRLGRDEFLQRLLGYRGHFPTTPSVKFSLKKFAPVVREKLDGLWEGTGVLRLWPARRPACRGPDLPVEVVMYLTFRVRRPTEENLAQPGWLAGVTVDEALVGRSERFLLREVARRRGLHPERLHDNWTEKTKVPNTGGVYLCDYNRDGILDMLVTDVNGYTLYQGLPGGRFKDVTEDMGLPVIPLHTDSITTIAAFVDLDGDGWEDLILGDRVFRNDRGKRFVDYTGRTNLRLPPDAGGVVAADYDRDGRVDLYVTRPGKPKADSWVGGKSGFRSGNELWRNLGDWQFENVTDQANASGGRRSTFSAAWLDADGDGWPDLYVINEFGDGILLVNQRNGTFREHPLTDRPCDFGTMGVAVGDIDNDGHIDLYAANMYSKAGTRVIGNLKPGTYPEPVMARMRRFVTGSQLHHNLGGLKFEQLGEKLQVHDVGWAYGAQLVDLDNDGFLDLFATCGFMSKDRNEQDG
jgi:hypothetical protein